MVMHNFNSMLIIKYIERSYFNEISVFKFMFYLYLVVTKIGPSFI